MTKGLHDAAIKMGGFLGADAYTLSRFDHPAGWGEGLPSSVIVSTWRSELDWEDWYNSPQRRMLAKEMEAYLISPEEHLVLSKNNEQVFLL